MKRERTAALSAVGLMLIAGCSGGRSVGSTPALPGAGGGQGASTSAPHNATLQIMIPPVQQGPQSTQHRTSGVRSTSGTRYANNARRHPTWISPFSAYGTLTAVPTNGGPKFSTSIAFSTCTVGVNYATYESYYNCGVSVPYGSNVFFLSIYDAYNNLLSTNQYANPAAQTVNPNGSPSTNTIAIYEQGVVTNINQESPVTCFSTGYAQAVYLTFNDADGTPIFGPLANPITPTFTAYNGAGLGAIAPYAVYLGGAYPYSTFGVNNQTLYDTSMYFPYLWVSGQEGAVNVSATVQNLPVYNNGAYTYTPSNKTLFATGTYTAWGIGPGNYEIYPIAVQPSTNQAIVCDAANGTFSPYTYIGAIVDPMYNTPYLVVSDNNSNVFVIDALVTTNAQGHSFPYFNPYGGGLQFVLETPTAVLGSALNNSFIDFFTSSVVPGRFDILSARTSPGTIDLVDLSHLYTLTTNFGTYSTTTAVALNGNTRVAGSHVSGYVYYDQPGSPYLFASYVQPGSSVGAGSLNFASTSAITGQIYTIAPSGPTGTYIFARGASSTGQFYICEFDSNPAIGTATYCHTTSSYNANPSSMTFDPGSGALMFSGGYTGSTSSVYALAANQAPSTFSANPFGSAPFFTLQSATYRFTPTVATPGIVGLWGGNQTTGPCAGNGEVTWLTYSSGAFHYLASLCWPNHYITITYP